MDHQLFKELHAQGLISDESYGRIERKQQNPLFSIHWEINTLLYLGVLLTTTGLGILIYKNIETIGHQVILIAIGLISAGCFVYCFRYKKPFSTGRVQAPSTFFDYILLLGTLTFLIFIGYLQYQYQVFGTHYGMPTFIPMVVLFYIAYSFDHVGILNLAIINLGVWLGVAVTPRQLLAYGNFNSQTIIYTYIGFGFILLALGWLTGRENIKTHFKFSYEHYGVHVMFITLLAAYFHNYQNLASVLWLFGLLAFAALVYYEAFKLKTFYFLLIDILYSYFAISCLATRVCISGADIGAIYLLFIYYILSAMGLVYLLVNLNKQLKAA